MSRGGCERRSTLTLPSRPSKTQGVPPTPRIVVGTRFGVQVFGTDLKKIGGVSLPAQAAAFAGPGGKDKDRVYVVGPDGSVSVLVLK